MQYRKPLFNIYTKSSPLLSQSRQKGFSLVEVVISIVVLSIALLIIATLLLPAERQSADQLHQIKAAELAQSFINEITGKAFDENSDKSGGRIRCGEAATLCTLENNFGPDTDEFDPATGEKYRHLFDDVDDYHDYNESFSSTQESLHSGYNSFAINIIVTYGGAELVDSTGTGINNELAKKIIVTVTTPLGTDITFSSYRTNY